MFRSFRKSHVLAVAALSLAMPLSIALADEPSPGGTAQNPAAAAPIAAPQTPIPPGAIKHEQLQALLQGMGYQPKVYDNNIGTHYYALLFDRNGWTMSMTVSIAADYSYIWLSAPLTTIQDTGKVSPQALLKLMEQSFVNGPAYFSFRPEQNNRICLALPIPNKDVSAVTLRARIESFCDTIQQTQAYWSQQALMPAAGGGATANAK